MDPIAQDAKSRFTAPKPGKPEQKTELQQALEQNAFAQALATPVRKCVLTYARLPSHFLLPFVSTLPALSSSSPADEAPPAIKATLRPDIGTTEHPHLLRSHTRSYIVARKAIINISTKKKWWHRLAPMRVQEWFAKKSGKSGRNLMVGKAWVWDEKMSDVVAETLREGVREALGTAELRRVGVGPDGTMAELQHAAFVLYYAGHVPRQDGGADSLESIDTDGGDHVGTTMPNAVKEYDLSQLFPPTDTKLETILRRSDVHGVRSADSPAMCIVPRGGRSVVSLEMALTRLQSYLRCSE